MIGYKVVRAGRVPGEWRSAIMDCYQCVHYRVGEWAYPRPDCGALCVFDSIYAALMWVAGDQEFTVFKAEFDDTNEEVYYRYYNNNTQEDGYLYLHCFDAPEGTRFASRIKLLEICP